VPTCPFGNDVVVILTGNAAMLIERAWVADAELLSVALTVKFEFPVADGVPLICPAGLTDKPAGKAPVEIDHVYGGVPPLAARFC